MRCMPRSERAQSHGCGPVDVPASRRSDLARRSGVFRSGSLLDHQERDPVERHAGIWEGRVRRAHLGSGFLCPRLAKGRRGWAMTNLTTTAHSERNKKGPKNMAVSEAVPLSPLNVCPLLTGMAIPQVTVR